MLSCFHNLIYPIPQRVKSFLILTEMEFTLETTSLKSSPTETLVWDVHFLFSPDDQLLFSVVLSALEGLLLLLQLSPLASVFSLSMTRGSCDNRWEGFPSVTPSVEVTGLTQVATWFYSSVSLFVFFKLHKKVLFVPMKNLNFEQILRLEAYTHQLIRL